MMRRFFLSSRPSTAGLLTSKLLNETTFYAALQRDMNGCRRELIIESPFITSRRTTCLLPVFRKLIDRGVRMVVNTRHPGEHDDFMRHEAEDGIAMLQEIGVDILFTGGHHRKLVIVDRTILYEGSLNVLSHGQSCEVMRRIDSNELAQEIINFAGLDGFLNH